MLVHLYAPPGIGARSRRPSLYFGSYKRWTVIFRHPCRAKVLLRVSLLATAAVWIPRAGAAQQRTHALPGEDHILPGEPAELYTLGALDGEPWEVFSGIRAIGFDDAGHLYVLDRSVRVFVYDREGQFVRQIGSEGRGPGEIGRPTTMAVGDGGTVVVVDPTAGYHVFGSGGEYEYTVRSSSAVYGDHALLTGGGLVVPGGLRSSMRANAAAEGLPVLRQPLRRDAVADTLYIADVPTVQTAGSRTGGRWTFGFRTPPRFSPTIRLARAGAGRVAIAYARDWRVEILDASGSPTTVIERPIEGRPSRAADHEAVVAQERTARRGLTPPGVATDPDLDLFGDEQPLVAPTIPAVVDIRGDGKGLLFVQRTTDPVLQPGPPIDIVTATGSYIGTLIGQELPAALGPDRLAAYVTKDELGVERVLVRRLPTSWLGD